jgi:mannose-6-phosphate isomerase-like protein (cupin superfamily)
MDVQGKLWGHTRPLFCKNNVEVHDITIVKGGYCSMHKHHSKFNRFVVRRGKLKVTIRKNYGHDILDDVTILLAGESCTVNPGDYHMFEALEETEALEIYWVTLNESDIERLTHGGRR